MKKTLSFLSVSACVSLLFGVFALVGAPVDNVTAQESTAESTNQVVLQIATLAPRRSLWMRAFRSWKKNLKEATNNTVVLEFEAGSSRSNEHTFITRMNEGSLAGATLTPQGIHEIAKSALVLTAPGLCADYACFNRMSRRLEDPLASEFNKAGYQPLGYSYFGQVRVFSTHTITQPSHLSATKPWSPSTSPFFGQIARDAGASPVSLRPAQVRSALSDGRVDTIVSTSLGVIAMQWHTHVQHVTSEPLSVAVGTTVLTKSAFDSLTAAQKEALLKTGAEAHQKLSRAIQREDDRAFRTLQTRGVTADDTSSSQAAWNSAVRDARTDLAGSVYSEALLRRAERAAAR